MDSLYVVIPAYNEEESIAQVVREWHEVVEAVGGNSRLIVINDGSGDSTGSVLAELKRELPCLEALNKTNSGHGGTVLYGYRYALEQGADFVFQTDSDGQTVSGEFWPFWEQRNNYDIQIGNRGGRQDGFSRVIVTKVLKLVLFFSFGLWITDANAPFRLMNSATLRGHLDKIPKDYNLSNVLLTVLYEKSRARIRYVPITFRPRQGGVNSINLKKIARIGMKAISDFRRLRKGI